MFLDSNWILINWILDKSTGYFKAEQYRAIFFQGRFNN